MSVVLKTIFKHIVFWFFNFYLLQYWNSLEKPGFAKLFFIT